MVKKTVSVQDVCDLLNELLKMDYDCIKSLFIFHVNCNETVAKHPTIQVQQSSTQFPSRLGFLGILNGIFGVRENGMGPICCDIDNSGHINCFKPTPKPYVEY